VVRWLALAAALAPLACWRAPMRGIDFGPEHDPYRNQGHVDAAEIRSPPVFRLLLLGDGGEPGRDDATFALLGEWGNAHAERTAVVFLGDNLYPAGLQRAPAARAYGESVLLQQVHATRARELFIPGNHDWGLAPFQRASLTMIEPRPA